MVGGHRQDSLTLGSSSWEDYSGNDDSRMPSGAEGSGAAPLPRNLRHRVPANTGSTLPSAQTPPAGAAGGAESVVRQGRVLAAPLAGGELPQLHQQYGRRETPPAPSQEREAGARRRLEFEDATPAQALQAAQLLLRHPPIPAQDGTPAAPWLQDVMALIDTAQRQATQGASLGPSRRTPSTGGVRNNSAARPPHHSPRHVRGEAGGSGSHRRTVDPAPQTEASRPRRRRRRRRQEEESLPRSQRSEDLRTTLERRREQRREEEPFEDQASSGPTPRGPRRGSPVGRRPEAHGALGPRHYSGGCLAFTDNLRRVRWPEKFRLAPIEKYDGTANPDEFLQIYTTVVEAAGGTSKVMANYFPTALTGSARSWLMNLPHDSIRSCEDLCNQFVANFQGTSASLGEKGLPFFKLLKKADRFE